MKDNYNYPLESYKFIILDLTNNTYMPKDYNQQREELSDDGKRLWDEMMRGEQIDLQPEQVKRRKQPRPIIIEESEQVQKMRLELRKLQQNSRIVISECNELQKQYVKTEQYFKANECRVAAFCHQNFIDRIQKVLNGMQAFESEALNSRLEQDLDSTDSIHVR